MGKYTQKFNARIQAVDKERYHREQYQSFMTGPEWRNVEMAREYGDFIRENKSLFQFPYFGQIGQLWKVLYQSYKAARRYNSPLQIIFSEYMLMDLFVVLFTTLELVPKGILSLLLYPFLKKDNQTDFQRSLADYYESYAKDLETIPFYDHRYKAIRETLQQDYERCENPTWVDWFSWKCVSIELSIRRWLSKPLSYWFHQEGNQVPATTDILVKFDAYYTRGTEDAKTLFQEQLGEVAKKYSVNLVDQQVYAKETNKGYISVYARLSAPRYATFLPVVDALAKQQIHLRKIAGQDRVQVKCVINAKDEDERVVCRETLNRTKKVTPLYVYGDSIHPNRQVCLFDAPVRNLHKTLHQLQKEEETTVEFIHNF